MSRVTRTAVSAGTRRGAVAITSITLIPGSNGTTTVKRPSVTSAGRPSTVTADARGETLPRTSAVPRRTVDPSLGAVISKRTCSVGNVGGSSSPPQPATDAASASAATEARIRTSTR